MRKLVLTTILHGINDIRHLFISASLCNKISVVRFIHRVTELYYQISTHYYFYDTHFVDLKGSTALFGEATNQSIICIENLVFFIP